MTRYADDPSDIIQFFASRSREWRFKAIKAPKQKGRKMWKDIK